MTFAMDDPRVIAALLDWQAELGADDFIGDTGVDRFALHEAAMHQPKAPVASARPQAVDPAPTPKVDPVAEARTWAARSSSLPHLAESLAQFPHCDLRKGARNFIFGEGEVGAEIMVIGDPPGPDEDRQGRAFAGRAGQLFDRMMGAIGRDRTGLYLAHVLPWRPPAGRDPEAEELAMIAPFLRRQIELVAPKVVVVMGNPAAQMLLDQPRVAKIRGQWTEISGRPALPMLHPQSLLRQPYQKREAWADLLSLQARLRAP